MDSHDDAGAQAGATTPCLVANKDSNTPAFWTSPSFSPLSGFSHASQKGLPLPACVNLSSLRFRSLTKTLGPNLTIPLHFLHISLI